MNKRLYLLLFSLLLGFSISLAQTYTINISGAVTTVGTGAPVANHTVYIMFDSLSFPYFGTAITNAQGQYSVTVTGVNVSPGSFWVYTYDCNNAFQGSGQQTYNSMTTNFPNINFQICTGVGACNANFSSSGNPGSTVFNFTDLSTSGGALATVNSWFWDFGDGNTSTQQNPTHAYNAMGPFTVCLTIGTTQGCTATFCDSVSIGGGGSTCSAFFGAQGQGCTFSFVDSSYSQGGGPLTYAWDFGDGNVGTGSNATHTYANGGTYVVCLTIADNQSGCTDTYCQTISATCGTVGNCQASYFWYPDTTGQYTITIVNTSTGNFLSYFWDFGDGSTSNLPNPTHVYAGLGTYVVCLTVIDSFPGNTCVSTFCDSIPVLFRLGTPFSINVVNGTVNVDKPLENVLGMQIAPNPAQTRAEIRFMLNEGAATMVQVMDVQGRVVQNIDLGHIGAGSHGHELNLDGLKSGLYMIQVTAGEHRQVKKLIVTE